MGRERLSYCVEGVSSLSGYLRRHVLSSTTLVRMVESLFRALGWCAAHDVRYSNVLFEARFVYVTAVGELKFVLAPVEGAAPLVDHTPLTLLEALCQARHRQDPSCSELVRALEGFVRREEGLFSLNALRSLVRDEFGMADASGGAALEQSALAPAGDGCQREGLRIRRHATDEVFPLGDDCVTKIGRGADCGISIQGNRHISRAHACVRVRGSQVQLWDVGSKNGTWVDGRRLGVGQRVSLRRADSFCLDDEEFSVL